MKQSFGKRFTELRKNKGYTQEDVANKLNISPQAVSKWENDISFPDVSLLLDIGEMFGTTVDELLGKENQSVTVLPVEERKDPQKMLLKIVVNSSDGDKVRINLPLALIKIGIDAGMAMPQISGNDSLKGIDFQQIMSLVEEGLIGKILEVESADGDIVEIYVE